VIRLANALLHLFPSSPLCVFFRCWPVMGNLYGARGQFKLLQQCGLEKRGARVNIVNNASTLNEFQHEEMCEDGVFHQLFSQTDIEERGA